MNQFRLMNKQIKISMKRKHQKTRTSFSKTQNKQSPLFVRKKSENKIFHLEEPSETNQAKIQLFSLGEDTDFLRTSLNKTSLNFRKNNFHEVFQSWHGESMEKKQNPEKKIVQEVIKKEENHPKRVFMHKPKKTQSFEQKRKFLRSAFELRTTTNQNLQDLKKSIKTVHRVVPTHPKVITFSPTMNEHRSLSHKKQGTPIKKRKRPIKSAFSSLQMSGNLDSDSKSNSQKINYKSTLLNESTEFAPFPLPNTINTQGDQVKKGLCGSILKTKQSKKGKWIDIKSKLYNISRVYDIKNNEIKGEIGKIMKLINQEDWADGMKKAIPTKSS